MTGWATAPTLWSVNRLCIGKNKKSSYSKLAISLRGGKRKQTKPREKKKREEKSPSSDDEISKKHGGGGAGYRRNEEGRPWEAVDRARKYLPVDPRHDQFNAEEQVRLGACELAESSADV